MSDQHALEANGAEPDSVDPVAEFRAALASRVGDWYVVHTYAGYENRVKANLETRIQSLNMEDYIFEIDVPMEEVTEIKNGQKKIVRRVRMPGYVLVRMDMTDASWGAVRHTPGVTGFVGNAHQPFPLSIDEVVAAVFRAPASYTREDVVELSCHGGRLPAQRALAALIGAGALMCEANGLDPGSTEAASTPSRASPSRRRGRSSSAWERSRRALRPPIPGGAERRTR